MERVKEIAAAATAALDKLINEDLYAYTSELADDEVRFDSMFWSSHAQLEKSGDGTRNVNIATSIRVDGIDVMWKDLSPDQQLVFARRVLGSARSMLSHVGGEWD
jgi:hypothetical protein